VNLSRRKDRAGRVELADLIDRVAEQLLAAEQRAAQRSDRVMRFTECELEMAISIETGGEGGIKVWVLELGGSRKKTDSNTITVKFRSLEGRDLTYAAEDEGSGPELGAKD
jgi:hypothetical protein